MREFLILEAAGSWAVVAHDLGAPMVDKIAECDDLVWAQKLVHLLQQDEMERATR